MGHAPNTWPPHQRIAMQAIRTLRVPDNRLSGAIPQLPKGKSGFGLVQDGRPCRINLVR
ncbi:hypothetical protein BGW80DRAFT_1414070 [Lactifluus volemus]|nr:hypothetical protein BGW80DRAFT_1414070 [Lactifluus volemus]